MKVFPVSIRRIFAREIMARGGWAISDQAIASLGNFVVNLALARNLIIEDFGIFVLFFSIFLFANRMHSSLINYPLTIVVSEKSDIRVLGSLFSCALFLTSLLMFPFGIIIYFVAVYVGNTSLVLWAVLAMGAWQLQETTRRALMAQLRYRSAILGDSVKNIGQVTLIIFAINAEILTLETAFAAIAISSTAAAVIQAVQIKILLPNTQKLRQFVSTCWQLGRWVILSSLAAGTQMQLMVWILVLFHGLEETAKLRAVGAILAVTHPITIGIGNFLIPMIAHASQSGIGNALRTAFVIALLGGLIIFPYFIVLAIWPETVLNLFLGSESPYSGLSILLYIIIVTYVISYLTSVTGGILGGLRRPKLNFYSRAAGFLTSACIGAPLCAIFGLYAASAGNALSNVVSLAANTWFLHKMHYGRQIHPQGPKREYGRQ